ncbi:autophagy-related protein 16 [Boeremia exigua]|uniref:autophagy-related protein 16 n=1 Tax=Boeremia exigua TaxID=749465 RepID=UPI001E8DAF1D|nr:autophagy-related protein 16 [Boeremia exigua]KAH6625231.1 autophagy-related protein 16 [Boeremia exigua]
MSNALAEYLSALDARDARERAHEAYIHAYTKLADRTAAQARPTAADDDDDGPARDSTKASDSTKTIKAASRGKSSPAPPDAAALTQLRAELAATQKTRAGLEAELSTVAATLAGLQAADAQQKQRISQLEKHRAHLERRGKDKQEELKGKGRFVEEIQDEMVAMNLQLNMTEQENARLKTENEELTRRWVSKMEDEARRMNAQMGWEGQ